MPRIKEHTYSRDSVQNIYQRKVFKRNGTYYLFYADRMGDDNELLYRHADTISGLVNAPEIEATSAESSGYQYGGDYDVYFDRANDRVIVAWLKKSPDSQRHHLLCKSGRFQDDRISWENQQEINGGESMEFKNPILAMSPGGHPGICTWCNNDIIFYAATSAAPESAADWVKAGGMFPAVGDGFSDHRVCGIGENGADTLLICRNGKDLVARRWDGQTAGEVKKNDIKMEAEERMSGAVADADGNVHLLVFSESGGNVIRHAVFDAAANDWGTTTDFPSPAGKETQEISLAIDCAGTLHSFLKRNVPSSKQETAEQLFYINNADGQWADKTETLPEDFRKDFWDFRDSPSISRNPVGELLTAWVNITEDEKNELWLDAVPLSHASGPKADFSASASKGFAPLTVQFADESTAGVSRITRRKWDFGDGNNSAEEKPEHTYNTPGQYTVSLTVTDGCESSDTMTKTDAVTVHRKEEPAANFEFDPQGECLPMEVKFKDVSVEGSFPIVSYQWDFGDGNTSTEQHPSHQYAQSGLMNVSLTVKDDQGVEGSTTKTVEIPEVEAPKANFELHSHEGYHPLEVSFRDTSQQGTADIASWEWDFGDGNTSTEQHPIHVYQSAGTFTVKLKVSDRCQLTDIMEKADAVQVDTQQGPRAIFDFELESGCMPLKATFTDGSTPGSSPISSHQWDFGDGNSSSAQNPTHEYKTSGNYTAALTVTDDSGLTNSAEKTVIIPESQPPIANFEAAPAEGTVPLTVAFTDKSGKGSHDITAWEWNFGDDNTSTDQHPRHTYNQEGTYDVTLTVKDDCGKETSLTKSGAVTVQPPVDECAGLGLRCVLCYLLFWVSGLICFFFGKNKCIKFHGLQSLICFGIIEIFLLLALYVLKITVLAWILGGIAVALWIFLMLKVRKCTIYKLPVIGEFCYRRIFG